MKSITPLFALALAALSTPAAAELAPVEAPCTDHRQGPCRGPVLLLPAPAPVADDLVVHSPALAAGGALLTVIGSTTLISGTALLAIFGGQGSAGSWLAIPLMIDGAACLAGGIPMIVIGSRKIPRPMEARPPAAPALSIGPGAVSLRWTF